MRAVYFRGEGVVELVEISKPEPGEGQLLIQVAANGVCGSDRKILRSGFHLIPGHEVVGTVVEAGPGCETPLGTRIAVYIPMHCGECAYCQEGRGNLCPSKKGLVGWTTNGGYAEYMLVPDRNALRLDDRISFEEGVLLLDTIGTAGHGVRLSNCRGVDSALIIGAGPVGMGALAMMKAFGVPRVYVAEISPYRRARASDLGGLSIDPRGEDLEARIRDEHPYGVDVVFEAVGSPQTIWQSFDLVRPGGTVNLVGEHWGKIELERPKGRWMINDITAIRSFYFTIPEFYENQQMILDGELDAKPLVTHVFALEQVRDAYDQFATGESIKILVTPKSLG